MTGGLTQTLVVHLNPFLNPEEGTQMQSVNVLSLLNYPISTENP